MGLHDLALKEHVNSSNITALSLKAAFNQASKYQIIPSTESVYAKILKDFDFAIRFAKTHEEEIALQYNRGLFVELTTSRLPDGFEIVPVLSSRVFDDKIQLVRKEFNKNIDRKFTSFISFKYPYELKKLGVAEKHLNIFKNGWLPKIGEKLIYDLNRDHIIECSLAGKFATTQQDDKFNKAATSNTFIVNHFLNLLLLPQKIHQLKNSINHIQFDLYNRKNIKNDEWFLMLIPKKNPETSGFITHPQSDERKFGIIFNAASDKEFIEHIKPKISIRPPTCKPKTITVDIDLNKKKIDRPKQQTASSYNNQVNAGGYKQDHSSKKKHKKKSKHSRFRVAKK